TVHGGEVYVCPRRKIRVRATPHCGSISRERADDSSRAPFMIDGRLAPLLRYVHQVAGTVTPGLSDAELLERFVARRDEGAFAALVGRHGPMVFAVCRRVLANAADAEDAFQATFLVLARRARSIGRRELLGSWLHGVAFRTALKARAGRWREDGRERAVPAVACPLAELARRELRL